MIKICEICHKPIYSWDSFVWNDSGMFCHSDCFKGLTYNFIMGKIHYPRKNIGKVTEFDKAFYILTTMKGENMIKFEHSEVLGWEHAIRSIPAKGYRQTKNGRYEAFVSDHSKSIFLGTYDTPKEAKEAVFNYRADRFVSGVRDYGLNPNDGVVYEDNYVVFENGVIFNLHGERMIGGINKSGYRQGIFNGRNRDHHKIIADCFIPDIDGFRDVDHKNGDKLDICAENLERVTHSENVKRAYETGLMKKQCGEDHHAHKLTAKDVEYIRSVYSKRDPNYGAVALSKKFGVDRTTIHDIVNGKTWRY